MTNETKDENENVTSELGEKPSQDGNLSQTEGPNKDEGTSDGEGMSQGEKDPEDAGKDKPDGGGTSKPPKPPKVVPTVQESAALAHVKNQSQLLKQIQTDPNADYPVVDPVHGFQKISDVVRASIEFSLSALRPELRDFIIENTEKASKVFTFFDDLFYRTAMLGKIAVIELFLRILLGDTTLKLTSMELQRHFDFPKPYHSIISDTYCESEDQRIFSIEIQNDKREENSPRAIFDGHVIGFASLQSGNNYKTLRPTYIIFLTDQDVPGTKEFIHWEKMHEFDPRIHTIFVNCSYGFRRIRETTELETLLIKVEQETKTDEKKKMERRIDILKRHEAEQDAKMKAETAKYGMSEETWKEILVYGHDFMTSDWKYILRPDLAELMRLTKEPIAEGVSLMNAVLWSVLEEAREEVRQEKDQVIKAKDQEIKENNLRFAAYLLKKATDVEEISDVTGLSRDEIQNLANSSAP